MKLKLNQAMSLKTIQMNKKKYIFLAIIFLLSKIHAEKIIFSANSMTGQAGNTNTTTYLSGNAYIKTDSMEIQAEFIELSGEDYKNIKAEGKVIGKNIEANMEFTCDSLNYNRVTKVAQLNGNVNLDDKDNDVNAKAEIITYNQEEDIAILQMKVNLLQKDNVCSGSYAVYYKKTQILELSGNAQVKKKDDIFRAQVINFDMNTQDIKLGGNVKGTVKDSKEKPDSENENDLQQKKKDNQEKAENLIPENAEQNSSQSNNTSENKTEETITDDESEDKPQIKIDEEKNDSSENENSQNSQESENTNQNSKSKIKKSKKVQKK